MKEQKEKFTAIYNEYRAMVMQVCMGFVNGDIELASDLMQDIFINVWNALPGYRGDASYKTWIYRITVNSCLGYIRKHRGIYKVSYENNKETGMNFTEEVEKNSYGTLYKAIGKLSEIDRLIIMMVLDEMEYDEISKVMGISYTTLRVKIHRIKERLKKIIKQSGAD